MGGFKDISGQKFERLTAIRFVERRKNRTIWEFECICGNIIKTDIGSVRDGNTKSCGCYRKEVVSELFKKHGYSGQGEYKNEYMIWAAMKKRCYGKRTKNNNTYLTKGIIVCDRWLHSFENFIADMGKRPTARHSIDRIDNNGNYESSNCRWATYVEQANNKKDNIIIEYKGIKDTVSNLARIHNINAAMIRWRYVRGWDINKIFETPINYRHKFKIAS